MILAKRPAPSDHGSNYGCVNANIDALTGQTDTQQETYLELANNVFPAISGAVPWVRVSRNGIAVTSGYPDWNTVATRYWPNMYFRPATADFMKGRYIVFEPALWTRLDSGSFRINPCAGPNYFGRTPAGSHVVADA